MAGDPSHPTARAVRAARIFSGRSRKQVADRLDLSEETIGRWERGDWRGDPPRTAMIEAIVRDSGLLEFIERMAQVEERDPATRFAIAARQEGRRRGARPGSGPGARPDAGAEGEQA
jgi:transcriptional regulator with XRE-family HTH domain